MKRINYRRHFTLILAAAVLLGFAFDNSRISTAIAGYRAEVYFASVGLLHATALVLALRVSGSFTRRLLFVIIATMLSIAAPYVGAGFATVSGLSDEAVFFLMFAAASAAGACIYWLLIRAFWLPDLAVLSLVQTLVFCVIATLISFPVAGIISGFGSRPTAVSDDLATIFWWLAFSSSLFLADRSRLDNTLQRTSGVEGV